jgi:hypothetical protein
LHAVKADGTISSRIEAAVETISRTFRPELYEQMPVYITSVEAKGFLCWVLKVQRVSPSVALKRPLDSGLVFSINHSSGAVKKLVENVPYENIIDAQFVFLFNVYVLLLTHA